MNRIILIGNGFDLAHDMKTSYRNFLDKYILEIKESIDRKKFNNEYFLYMDTLSFISKDEKKHSAPYPFCSMTNNPKLLEKVGLSEGFFYFRNEFIQSLFVEHSLEHWVDIENEYYDSLCKTIDYTDHEERAKDLNESFNSIKTRLRSYLLEQSKNAKAKKIHEKIFSPIDTSNLSKGAKEYFIRDLIRKIPPKDNRDAVKDFIRKELNHIKYDSPYFDLCTSDFEYAIQKFYEYFPDDRPGKLSEIDFNCIRTPREILFLNFNYTDTSDFYKASSTITNHIHGDLFDEKNPMVFGYGDTNNDCYKRIKKLKNPEFLKNIKSINYPNTENYNSLIHFIGSDLYQIFIMGHSCGKSDMSLLKTLFEHENCACIKVFYHKREGSDNYSEIVRNIALCFDDESLILERVVNKNLCEPLLDYSYSRQYV